MSDEFFIDTNILVYAFDETEKQKHKIAQGLVRDITLGRVKGVVSNQVLGELFVALTKKLEKPIDKKTTQIIINGLIDSLHWRKINYTEKTISKAVETSISLRTPFWDSVILETMLENKVYTILTENTKDFPIGQITSKNPFKE